MPTPFKITIKLGSPVCLTFPFIHLDGIMSFLVAIDKYKQKLFEFSRMSYYDLRLPLPLKKTKDVYHASVAIFQPEGLLHYTRIYKRFEDRFVNKLRKRKLVINSGYFRYFAIAEPYITASHVIFYGCGDVEKIKYLFETYLVGIGNDVRIGWGSVRDIQIKEIDRDMSLIFENKAMRVLPVSMLKKYSETAYLSYKPPYWYKGNIDLCVPPGAECEL